MLVGVPGGGDGLQPQPPQVDLVAVAKPPVRISAAPGGGGQHLRAVGGRELAGAGEEVGVQVSIRRKPDGQAPPGGGRAHGPQIARRVHDERPAVPQVDQVGRVAQPLVDEADHVRAATRPRVQRLHLCRQLLHLTLPVQADA